MASRLKGISIILINKVPVGTDEGDRPLYSERECKIDNVLVGVPETSDVLNELNLSGKRIAYTIAIPKGDNHCWENTEVILPEPFAGRYRTIGKPTAGIEEMIPLDWNKKVKLEAYE